MHATKTSGSACAQNRSVSDAVASSHLTLASRSIHHGTPTMARPSPATAGAKKGTAAAAERVMAAAPLALPMALECKKTAVCRVDQRPVVQNTAMHSLLE